MRQHSADDYEAIRRRQEDLFGRPPVGEAHVNVPFVRELAHWEDLPKDGHGKNPCHCATHACPERTSCVKQHLDLSVWYCTGRLPREEYEP